MRRSRPPPTVIPTSPTANETDSRASGALDIIAQFTRDLRERQVSPETCSSYANDISQFAAGTGDTFPAGVTTAHVERFVRDGALSPRERRLSTLVAFFEWAKDCGIVSDNPAASVTRPLRPQTHCRRLSPAEIELLLARADEGTGPEPAIVHVLAATGMSARELAALVRGDITVAHSGCDITIAGRRPRTLKIAGCAAQQLSRWMKATTGNRDAPVFKNVRGGHLSRRGLDARLARWGSAAGLPFELNAQVIRNSVAEVHASAESPIACGSDVAAPMR